MSQEQNYDNLSYDEILNMARGSSKRWIPRLCAALKRENPNYSNYDIREIVMKDCVSIWQKDTIRDALPEEYKDKAKQEAARLSHKNKDQSGQTTEFVPDENPAEPSSVGSIEDVSESFDNMNRGPDVITESEKVKKLENRLNESETERTVLRQEIDVLKNDIKVLQEKTAPELLRELQEKFYNEPGLLDAKKLQKVSMEAGKNLMLLVERYNSIIQEAVESGKPVPFGTYIMTKPDMKLVPVNITVDFDRRKITMSLWEKKLQSLSY
jgi:hypothetical protein